MRVLYAAFDVVPSPKGASRHITAFARALSAAGHDVTLFTVGLADMPAVGRYADARIIRHHSADPNFLRRATLFGEAVWKHLRDEEYDLVHFRDIWSGMAAMRLREQEGRTYRTLFEVNGLPSVELKYHYPALRESELPSRLRLQERQLLAGADAVVCVSRVTAIYLRSIGAAQERLSVIPNGIDPSLFAPHRGKVETARLVYVGTLTEWQGVATLIAAMPEVLAARPDAELQLIGPAKSRYRKALNKLATRLGLDEETVRFLDPVPPELVNDYLQKATVCIAPLTYNDRNVTQGCCPIKVLEYAAAGRPIVAADLPVVRELLNDDEALFFCPGDADDLAHKILGLLSAPHEAGEMGQRASRRVRAEFTWDRAGQRLLTVYAKLEATTLRTPPSMPFSPEGA